MDFSTHEDCVRYIETRVLFHLRSEFKKIQDDFKIIHHSKSNLVAINFRDEVEFEKKFYKEMIIMVLPKNKNLKIPTSFQIFPVNCLAEMKGKIEIYNRDV